MNNSALYVYLFFLPAELHFKDVRVFLCSVFYIWDKWIHLHRFWNSLVKPVLVGVVGVALIIAGHEVTWFIRFSYFRFSCVFHAVFPIIVTIHKIIANQKKHLLIKNISYQCFLSLESGSVWKCAFILQNVMWIDENIDENGTQQ